MVSVGKRGRAGVKKQILVIDDDIHIGNMLEEVLGSIRRGSSRAAS